ncbi:hypothetical protein B9479_004230 [Cryptococcus floricola]|uniref:Uncharacterized protein n=1 Tax=Cryptococcus floricola TaxID=2591691 RepID=A0A5D3AW52_9TREE|nr:hypothetical protein B9479_004230 [Cryptococcus floricola]
MASLEELGKASIDADPVRALMPLFFAMGADSLLMGGIAQQLFTYCMSSRGQDKLHIQGIIYFSSFCAAVVTFYTWAWMMDMFTYKYGSYAQFIDQRWWAWYPLICSCCKIPIQVSATPAPGLACIEKEELTEVQVFYGERAWRINNCNPFIFISIGICLLLSTVGSFVWSFMTHTLKTQDYPSLPLMFFHLWPTACVVADLITTSSLLYGLHKSRNGWQGTDRLIFRLMRYVHPYSGGMVTAWVEVEVGWADGWIVGLRWKRKYLLLSRKSTLPPSYA